MMVTLDCGEEGTNEKVVWNSVTMECQAVHAPLTPIPVSGPFDRVRVDVIQFPLSHDGNRWPEVFATPDQSAATIAKLLIEQVVSRHGVPSEILSDRGRAFLSGLMKEV